MTPSLAQLRQLLSETPTLHLWWKCVELVVYADQGERSLLKDYLLEHASSDPEWAIVRVPCGDWPQGFEGWELCELPVRSITVLPEATEVYCPAGSFLMGASKDDEHAESEELPQREVTLTQGFWALSTPVTQEMYETITQQNPSSFQGPRLPVIDVNWLEAVDFCNQLSSLTKRTPVYERKGEVVTWNQKADGYRLPTEAEWEYMARAGCSSPVYGPLEDIAWFDGSDSGRPELDRPQAVGFLRPNAWGLYDVLGGVQEWCFDVMDGRAYDNLPAIDPVCWSVGDGFDNQMRVERGGSWFFYDHDARFSDRLYDNLSDSGDFLGFRVVRSAVRAS